MSFKVQPNKVKTFASELDKLSQASGVAHTYASHTKPNASGGSAFVRLLNSTTEVRPAVESFFQHLETLASMSADELIATAKYYQDTDTASETRADARYREVENTPVPKVGE